MSRPPWRGWLVANRDNKPRNASVIALAVFRQAAVGLPEGRMSLEMIGPPAYAMQRQTGMQRQPIISGFAPPLMPVTRS